MATLSLAESPLAARKPRVRVIGRPRPSCPQGGSEKEEGPGFAEANSSEPGAAHPTVPAADCTRPSRRRVERLVFTDELLYDPDTPTVAKLILAAHMARPIMPPKRAEILAALPFLTKDDHAAAMRHIASNRLAWVERGGNKHGKPIRLTKASRKVDTWRHGSHVVHVPVAPLARLGKGRGVEDGALVFALYHSEQHKRGAVQLSDRIAAGMLGWDRKKIERWRSRLVREGILREVRAAGRLPAIYVVTDALTPADLGRFDETKTRTLDRILVDETTVLPVYARPPEVAVIETRLHRANAKTRTELRDLAAAVAGRRPEARWVHAKDLLDGPLAAEGDYAVALELARLSDADRAAIATEPFDPPI